MVKLTLVHIRPFTIEDKPALIELWKRCGITRPWNDPDKDIERKLAVQSHMFLVGFVDDHMVASVMAGYDGHRGWVNYLAVCPASQRRGYGRELMQYAENLLRQAGCPKINIQIRSDNEDVVDFYRSLDYTMDEVVSMGKRLQHDN